MRAPDPSRSVEFVMTEADDDSDDEFDTPTPLRRARLPLLVSAAIAVIALAAFMIVSNPGTSPAGAPVVARPSATPTRHPQGLVIVHLAADGRRPYPTTNLAAMEAMCPVGTSCDLWFDTPARAAAAVTHVLPSATRLNTATLLVGDQLVSRRMTGQVGGSRLTITVGAAGPNDVLGWNASETPSSTLVTASAHVAGRLVSVSLQAPPGYDLSIPAARRLAADPRLASVSPTH